MPRSVRVALIAVVWLAVLPAASYAQASITGVVRDTSGAVLPGVTVEVASPALIEKVRSVVTDDAGQYRVENLRPGAYTVTISLPGFSTVRRDGIELTGSFTASVNAEMRVGAVEETITVTGESPVVDVQNTARQQVLDAEIINALPSGRNAATLAGFLPGVSISVSDPGGLLGEGSGTSGAITTHGNAEVRTLVNGISVASGSGSGNTGASNIAAYQEMAVDVSGISAEQKEGGVRMNLIPKEGGNTFAGNMYFGYRQQGDGRGQLQRGAARPRPARAEHAEAVPRHQPVVWRTDQARLAVVPRHRQVQPGRHIRTDAVQQERRQPQRVDLRGRHEP